MKARMIAVTMALVLAGAVLPAVAEETAPPQPRGGAVQELRQQFIQERAEILANILEKRAELVRLSAQKDPDIARVQELVKEIAELRSEQQKKCAEYRETIGVLRQPGLEPLGRPGSGGMGLGRGAGRARMRPGSQWLGRGYGAAEAPAGRPGPGAPQVGPGQRPGAGAPYAPAPGRGFGRGQGRFTGPGAGGPGAPGARPWGPGRFFVDRDNDGVCDYWQGWENPPRPPVGPPPTETEQPAKTE
jgi:hypothetical protein